VGLEPTLLLEDPDFKSDKVYAAAYRRAPQKRMNKAVARSFLGKCLLRFAAVYRAYCCRIAAKLGASRYLVRGMNNGFLGTSEVLREVSHILIVPLPSLRVHLIPTFEQGTPRGAHELRWLHLLKGISSCCLYSMLLDHESEYGQVTLGGCPGLVLL
jgi:hypothetical protein